MRPHRRQPTRLPRPWDSPGKNTAVGCHFLLQCMKVKSESEVTHSCPTPSDPMDCSLPGSSVHGIFQARVLEWGAIAFSGWYSLLIPKCLWSIDSDGSTGIILEHYGRQNSRLVFSVLSCSLNMAFILSCLLTFFLFYCTFELAFFLKFYFIFKLYIIVLVLPNIKMNPPQVYMFPMLNELAFSWL